MAHSEKRNFVCSVQFVMISRFPLFIIIATFCLLGACAEGPYEPCDIPPYTHIKKRLFERLNDTNNIRRRSAIYDQYGVDYSEGFKTVDIENVYVGDETDSLNVRFTVTDSSDSNKTSLALFVRCELAEHWYP